MALAGVGAQLPIIITFIIFRMEYVVTQERNIAHLKEADDQWAPVDSFIDDLKRKAQGLSGAALAYPR